MTARCAAIQSDNTSSCDRRGPRKRALCVGCDYPFSEAPLRGACNDALLAAHVLRSLLGFPADDICVLVDKQDGPTGHAPPYTEISRLPTRAVMLKALRWLVSGAEPDDVLFFSFSGYGCQIDDLDGYEGEGFSSAILPADYMCENECGDMRVIPTEDIRSVLLSVPPGVKVFLLMDCDHTTDIVDATGCTSAIHDERCWVEGGSAQMEARPRHRIPSVVEVDLAALRRGPENRESVGFMRRPTSTAFCLSASDHAQTALEMLLPTDPQLPFSPIGVISGQISLQRSIHGVVTWSWWRALQELLQRRGHHPTVSQVHEHVNEIIAMVRRDRHPRCDQVCVLTAALPQSNPSETRYCA
ncbi:hypothetical protein FOL47_011182, partial [Perkinsus chesapeaki]